MYPQEKIDRYLNGQMSPKERQLFQQEIATDSKLAEAVDLQRDMAHFFKTHEPELEKQLSDLGAVYFGRNDQRKSFNKWSWWLLAISLAGLFFVVWPNRQEAPAVEQLPPPDAQETDALEPGTDDKILPVTKERTEPTESSKPDKVNVPKGKTTPKKVPSQKRPIASIDKKAYEVNPVLENLIAENVRTSTITQVLSPTPDTTFRTQQTIPFSLKGNTTAQPPFKLLIYSNRPSDFDNDDPVLKETLSGVEKDALYLFLFNAEVKLESGLYYWMILSEKSSEVLYISKFKVGGDEFHK